MNFGKAFSVGAMVVGLLIGSTVAADVAATSAEKCKGGKGRAYQMLGLSEQQMQQMKTLRIENKDKRMVIEEKIKALREKGKLELLKSNPDVAVLNGYSREASVAFLQLGELETLHLLRVKTVLTPAQFEKLLSHEFMRKGEPGMHGGKGHRGCGDSSCLAGGHKPVNCPIKNDGCVPKPATLETPAK